MVVVGSELVAQGSLPLSFSSDNGGPLNLRHFHTFEVLWGISQLCASLLGTQKYYSLHIFLNLDK